MRPVIVESLKVVDVADTCCPTIGARPVSKAIKKASTGEDGKQYFIPLYNYAWGVFYRKTVFQQHGYQRWLLYQPADRFWTFQAVEAGLYALLALVLLAASVRIVRRVS